MSANSKHLSDNELLALREDGGSDPHVEACAHCQRRQAEFDDVLRLASQMQEPTWTPLQGEQLVHAARRRLRGRRRATVTPWKPALAGVLAGALGCLFLLMTWTDAPTTEPSSAPSPVAMQAAVGTEEADDLTAADFLSDDELEEDDVAVWLESYLVQTASADELLLELDSLSDDEYYALLEQ